MRCTALVALVLFTAVARSANDAPRVSGILDGKKVQFPEKDHPAGVKAIVGLLESCHDESLYQADERAKALKGDHLRLVLPKAITVRVMNEKVNFSELVFRLPLNTGVFWVQSGNEWRRFTKYEFQKEAPLVDWLRQAQAAD